MLLLISPAKTLDFESPAPTNDYTQADFLSESKLLVDELRALSPQAISSLMGVSDKLGLLNYDRFASWKTPFKPNNAKQALYAFQGDVYTGMQADTFSDTDLVFAQRHLRMLSGLYGLLRPLDLIQPYRLEMGTAFANARGDAIAFEEVLVHGQGLVACLFEWSVVNWVIFNQVHLTRNEFTKL